VSGVARGGRILAMALLVCCVGTAGAEETEREAKLRPLAVASRAEVLGLLVGRIKVEQRWNEILDEILYAVAPRGVWDPKHPAWKPARAVAAAVLRRESAAQFERETSRSIHNVVVDYYLDILNDEERERAMAFFTSPGGRVWIEARDCYLSEHTYGLPFRDETEPRAAYERRAAAVKKKLLNLPDEQTNAVYEFNNSPLGERLFQAQNRLVADSAGNVLQSELGGVALEHRETVAREVRAKVKGVPPASEKTYLGTVTMRADRGLDVSVEQYDFLRHVGTYPMHYDADALHWRDVAAGVPGIAPGETRPIYRDAAGRLSDRP
jgi:hypothetical protein